MISRRGLITGFGASLLAAPAIVRASSLMPVRALPLEWTEYRWNDGMSDRDGIVRIGYRYSTTGRIVRHTKLLMPEEYQHDIDNIRAALF